MDFKEVKQIDSDYHFQIYGRLPILLKKGKGSHVWILMETNTLMCSAGLQ